jgi:prepilin-type N-terminal cleavage/methylation domain-containing protein
MNSDSAKEDGFTLLEVLVAFLILSAALVAANQSLSYSLRSFASARMSRAADRVAEELFAERLGSSRNSDEQSGVAVDDLKWTLKLEPFALKDGSSEVAAERLTLDVAAPTDGRIIRRYVTYRSVQTNEVDNAQ